MYSLYDGSNNFDDLNFSPYPATLDLELRRSQSYIFTNIPYSTEQTALFNPGILYAQLANTSILSAFKAASALNANAAVPREEVVVSKLPQAALFDTTLINFIEPKTPPAYFVCRRLNWNTDCHLMQATNPTGTSIYVAYGGGDLVPFRLDAPFTVDKRQPAHMYALTHTFADQQYDSVQTISVANKPYIVGVTTQGGFTQYTNLSIDSTAGTADLEIGTNQILKFPTECYIAGQASSTLTTINTVNTSLGTVSITTGSFVSLDNGGNILPQQFQLLTYNNLVYMVRAVSNVAALGGVGGLGINLRPADRHLRAHPDRQPRTRAGRALQAQRPAILRHDLHAHHHGRHARHARLHRASPANTFYAPTIFIPIPELDAGKGFVADLSNFLGQQIWTFIYPEIVASRGATVNGVTYPNGFNLDVEGQACSQPAETALRLRSARRPVHHQRPYAQIPAAAETADPGAHQRPDSGRHLLALGQSAARSHAAHQHLCPANSAHRATAWTAPNIIYSSHNRPVTTPLSTSYMGMSVNSIRSISGVVYNIEESALSSAIRIRTRASSPPSPPRRTCLSACCSITTTTISATLSPYDPQHPPKGSSSSTAISAPRATPSPVLTTSM